MVTAGVVSGCWVLFLVACLLVCCGGLWLFVRGWWVCFGVVCLERCRYIRCMGLGLFIAIVFCVCHCSIRCVIACGCTVCWGLVSWFGVALRMCLRWLLCWGLCIAGCVFV